jgi:hypothetical protein
VLGTAAAQEIEVLHWWLSGGEAGGPQAPICNSSRTAAIS